MNQRKLWATFLALLLAGFSMPSQADHDCHDEIVGYETIYYGYAGCTVYTACGAFTDYQYFAESPSPTVYWITHNPCNGGTALCQGALPNSTLSPIYEEVCEPHSDPGSGSGEVLFQGQCTGATDCESASRACYQQGGRWEYVSPQYYCYAD